MAASDDFKAQLKAGKMVEALALALTEAVELKVTTWIGSDETAQPQPGHRLRTRINILEGDIENEIGAEFLNNDSYKELQQFHRQQVQQSHKIVQNNLNSLQQLFGVWERIQRLDTDDALPLEAPRNPETLPEAAEIEVHLPIREAKANLEVEKDIHHLEEEKDVTRFVVFPIADEPIEDFEPFEGETIAEVLPVPPAAHNIPVVDTPAEILKPEVAPEASSSPTIEVLDWENEEEGWEEEWVVEDSEASSEVSIARQSRIEDETQEWEDFDPEALDYGATRDIENFAKQDAFEAREDSQPARSQDLNWINDLDLDADNPEDIEEEIDS